MGLRETKQPEGLGGWKRKEDGRDYLAHATPVAETACSHATHFKSHFPTLASRFAPPCGGFPHVPFVLYTGNRAGLKPGK